MVEFATDTRIAFPVWELDRILPKAKYLLSRCDLVLVPSKWQQDVFLRDVVGDGFANIPSAVINEGVDTSVFHPIPELRPQIGLSFIHIGKAEDRKGTKEIAEAFLKAFNGRLDFHLRMCIGNPFLSVDLRRAWMDVLPKHRTITYDWALLNTPEHVASILNRHHVFIGASKAEGWNLPQLEALACGLHVVGTANTGMSEYMNPEYSWIVPSGPLVTAKDGIFFNAQGMWHSVPADNIVPILKDVAALPNVQDVNGHAAKVVSKLFTWDAAAKALVSTLEMYGLL